MLLSKKLESITLSALFSPIISKQEQNYDSNLLKLIVSSSIYKFH